MGQRMAKGENVPSNAEKVTTTIPAHAYIDRGEVNLLLFRRSFLVAKL
jgi:hypothetical protein